MSRFDDPEILRSVLEDLPTGVYLVDRDGKILFWNYGAERITRHLRQDVVGHACREDFLGNSEGTDDQVTAASAALEAVLKDGKPTESQVSFRAWKVAYADFVTAMMALFIVLWLMNSSKQIQEAVGGYFKDPTGTAKQVGSDQVSAADNFVLSQDNMEQLKEQLQSSIKEVPKFDQLKNHIDMTVTNEGLRIELSESASGTFFRERKSKNQRRRRGIADRAGGRIRKAAQQTGNRRPYRFQAIRGGEQLRELGAFLGPRECGAAAAAGARHPAGSGHPSERLCGPEIAQER